jgi:adenosine deaminase
METREDNLEALAGLRAELWALPKVDLHRHLEGSLRVETLAEICREHEIDLPIHRAEHLKPLVTVVERQVDFRRFLGIFEVLRRFYLSQKMVERVAYEAVLDAAADNVKYLELRFNPVALAQAQGFALDDVTTWVCRAVDSAQEDSGTRTGLILQIGRGEPVATAEEIVEIALAHRDRGVVGVDLAGDESIHPAGRFALVFRRARREGLNVTVHAGEAGGAANVREAIEQLAAQRVGHGVRVTEDPTVVALARERGVTFEVCPISNLSTGVAGRSDPHPLPNMVDLGLRVTINTDDPSITDTVLTDDYLAAVQTMGLTIDQVKMAIVTAAESTFAGLDQRQQLVNGLRGALGLT